MIRQLLGQLTSADWIALCVFLASWIGYSRIADHGIGERIGLVGASHRHRLEWARRLMERDNRIADSALVGNLLSSVSFYANTTIYIIAGLLAVMGTLDKVISVTSDLPFAREVSRELWEVKILLLLAVFVVAYFKFTWSIRQFNFLSILIGASPESGADAAERERHAQRIARVNSYAGDEFNRGIRAYYFGLAAVSWFVHPWMFIALTAMIVLVMARRDFASPTLAVLRE